MPVRAVPLMSFHLAVGAPRRTRPGRIGVGDGVRRVGTCRHRCRAGVPLGRGADYGRVRCPHRRSPLGLTTVTRSTYRKDRVGGGREEETGEEETFGIGPQKLLGRGSPRRTRRRRAPRPVITTSGVLQSPVVGPKARGPHTRPLRTFLRGWVPPVSHPLVCRSVPKGVFLTEVRTTSVCLSPCRPRYHTATRPSSHPSLPPEPDPLRAET